MFEGTAPVRAADRATNLPEVDRVEAVFGMAAELNPEKAPNNIKAATATTSTVLFGAPAILAEEHRSSEDKDQ
jgi:hypothetical protein